MPYGQNSVHVTYRLLEGGAVDTTGAETPVGFRPHDAPVDRAPVLGYTLTARDRRIEIQGDRLSASSARAPCGCGRLHG